MRETGRGTPGALAEKIRNRETLTGKDLSQTQKKVLEWISDQMLAGKRNGNFEFGFRTPAVFFDSISPAEFRTLSAETQKSIRLVAEISQALFRATDKHGEIKTVDPYRDEISEPLFRLQEMIRDGNVSAVHVPIVAALAKELGGGFESAWNHGVDHRWRETEKADRVDYYSGNVVASASMLSR